MAAGAEKKKKCVTTLAGATRFELEGFNGNISYTAARDMARRNARKLCGTTPLVTKAVYTND